MSDIMANELLNIDPATLDQYKLHLATQSNGTQPLDVYVEDWNCWLNWNRSKNPKKNDFNQDYIFSMIRMYGLGYKWLFGGIFKVTKRHVNSYDIELMKIHDNLIGRLIIDYDPGTKLRGRSFLFKKRYYQFKVFEILRERYHGKDFPGYDNINITFRELDQIIKNQKKDWMTALRNIKGVYAVFDIKTGKKYVGSAYANNGIWDRWSVYAVSGHGWSNELTALINTKGFKYAQDNFKITLLDYRPMKTDDNVIIERESFWKEALLSRGNFGYNQN